MERASGGPGRKREGLAGPTEARYCDPRHCGPYGPPHESVAVQTRIFHALLPASLYANLIKTHPSPRLGRPPFSLYLLSLLFNPSAALCHSSSFFSSLSLSLSFLYFKASLEWMEISTGHRQRTMANDQLDEVLSCPKSSLTSSSSSSSEKKASIRPQPDQALRCPRCDSTNTKFCYYNNYSLSQPRYFCKGCRRYWTKGGSLRNVPVGGGCRKNKRSSSSIPPPSSSSSSSASASASASTSSSSKKLLLSSTLQDSMLIPPLSYEPSDLTLAFSTMHHAHHDPFLLANPNPNPNGHAAFQNQSFYYGFGGDDFRGMLSYDASADAAHAVVPNADPETNVDSSSSALRDYCNSSWHGLINSSLL